MVWKSNNQGVKKGTFIQTGRRSGDGQPGQRGHMWQGRGWWTRGSHVCLWINQEEQLGIETGHANLGSSAGKIKPQELWL